MVTSTDGEEPCEFLDWDSRHFHLRIGRVRPGDRSDAAVARVETWRAATNVDCLYLFVPVDCGAGIRFAERLAFQLVDIRVTLDRGPARETRGDPAEVRRYEAGDLAALSSLAGRLHRDSRFFRDRRFSPERSQRLFELWLEKACASPTHFVLVVERGGRPVAYIACERRSGELGQIQLIAVDESAQRQGAGGALVKAAVDQFTEEGATRVMVITQARNVAALRLYERHGFLTASHELCYHWWSPAQLRRQASQD